MPLFAIAFLCGDVLLQQFPVFPGIIWIIPLVIIIFTSILLIKKNKKIYLLIGFLLGFAWSLSFSYFRLSTILPSELESKNILIEGYIVSIPEITDKQTQFRFVINKINQKNKKGIIQLSWRDNSNHLLVGDNWKLTVRLKRIHSMRNPGSSDYESWAFQEGIIAHGYVINTVENKFLLHNFMKAPVTYIRQLIKEKMDQIIIKTNTSPWLYALAIGERYNIPQKNWDTLKNTGTNHLMAIAGLHIGFMSGFIFLIVNFIWRRSYYLLLKMPAQHAGAIAALIMTLFYSALAGFSIPTQRACIMVSVFLFYVLLRRKIISWSAWGLSLLLVLLINPLSVLSESFWLSFLSVAFIIYGVSGRLRSEGLWWKWGRIQWVITLGLIPLSIGLFQQCSLVSFVANAIAIPWVGFIILPAIGIACLFLPFSNKMSAWIFLFADKNLTGMWAILSYLSHLSWAVWYQFVPHTLFIFIAMCGIVLLLLPIGFPGRWLGIIGLLPIFLFTPKSPKFSEIKLTLLDVGQGLSTVIQTQHHLLVFDTGARLSDEYDMGNSVIVPFLRTLPNKKIDMLVISHGDNDHSGGAKTLLNVFSVESIKTSVPEKFSHAEYCLRGQSWNWDGVQFQFLYPSYDHLHLGNDSCCVLKITTKDKSILLTGDIEKLAEHDLYSNEKNNLLADILIAPHHGSKTSANSDFLSAVNPKYVLFSIGYKNRYHFPNNSVINKYNEMQVIQYDTVKSGAIQFLVSPKKLILTELYRKNNWHYWNK